MGYLHSAAVLPYLGLAAYFNDFLGAMLFGVKATDKPLTRLCFTFVKRVFTLAREQTPYLNKSKINGPSELCGTKTVFL